MMLATARGMVNGASFTLQSDGKMNKMGLRLDASVHHRGTENAEETGIPFNNSRYPAMCCEGFQLILKVNKGLMA